ncbi:uncharacterized protein LOC126354886 [Schistocerca gregaria]|uniref:uncharacterized protein LOC126354886 n=1 Tax=Schistocerca gregaria TaxID=7010 RepID=UPI00211E1B7F|nr:uncharacterized protein LOC126354886 [Schistocerca gregaria]
MSSEIEKEPEEKKAVEKEPAEKPPVEKPAPKRRVAPTSKPPPATPFYSKMKSQMFSNPNKYAVAVGATMVAGYVGYMAYMQTTTDIPAIKSDQARSLQRK